MRLSRFARLATPLVGIGALWLSTPCGAQEAKDLAGFFPRSTLLYVEARELPQMVRAMAASEFVPALVEWLPRSSDEARENTRQLYAIFDLLEAWFEHPGYEVPARLAGERAALGFIPVFGRQEPDWLLVLEPSDRQLLDQVLAKLVPLLTLLGVEVEQTDLSGTDVMHLGDGLCIVRHDSQVLAAPKQAILEAALERLADGTSPALAGLANFRPAPAGLRGLHAWSSPLLTALITRSKKMEAARTEPATNLLLGPLFAVLDGTETLEASLTFSPDSGLQIRLRTHGEWNPDDPSRQIFLPPQANDRLPDISADPEHLATLQLRRQWSTWWEQRADLLGEDGLANTRDFAQGVALLFSGKEFGADVLRPISADVRLVLFRQNFADLDQPPQVRYPGAALVARIDEKEKSERMFRMAFQTAAGLGNVGRGQNGQSQMLLESREHDGAKITVARFEVEEGEAPPIEANFSPALAVAGDLLVIASSEEALERVLAARRPGQVPGVRPCGDHLQLTAPAIARILRDNHEALALSSSLSEGIPVEEAEQRLTALFDLLDLVREMSLVVTPEQDGLQAEFTLAPLR